MNKICFIMPFFGKFPSWFPFWLKSCEHNPTVSWIFYTDCEIPAYGPPNVGFIQGDLTSFNTLASDRLQMDINLQYPYKICELRPAFGNIFSYWLKDFDFWGYGDLDLIYGNIKKFCTDDILRDYDVISGRKKYLTGHCAIYRNSSEVNNAFRKMRWHQFIFQHQDYKYFDERHMTAVFRYQCPKINVLFENFAGSDGGWCLKKWHKENGWEIRFDHGNIKNMQNDEEYMYFHFYNLKKDEQMFVPEVGNVPDVFSITDKGIKI